MRMSRRCADAPSTWQVHSVFVHLGAIQTASDDWLSKLEAANHGTHYLRSKSRADHMSIVGMLFSSVRYALRSQWATQVSRGYLRLEITISQPRDAPDDPHSLKMLGHELAENIRDALRWGDGLEYRHISSAKVAETPRGRLSTPGRASTPGRKASILSAIGLGEKSAKSADKNAEKTADGDVAKFDVALDVAPPEEGEYGWMILCRKVRPKAPLRNGPDVPSPVALNARLPADRGALARAERPRPHTCQAARRRRRHRRLPSRRGPREQADRRAREVAHWVACIAACCDDLPRELALGDRPRGGRVRDLGESPMRSRCPITPSCCCGRHAGG